MLRKLFTFKGGVEPETHKAVSTRQPIGVPPLPSLLTVPLHQNVGGKAVPRVRAGERVLKGQCLGGADGWISSAVHAPTSGKVRAVEPRTAAHPSGLPTLSVVIEPDGLDQWVEHFPLNYSALSPEETRTRLRDAGIVGLGGAAFPTHAKLSAAQRVTMEALIINGAECEPFMTCDDLLMRERAEGILSGAAFFHELLETQKVLIGIEDNKPDAIAAMRQAARTFGSDFEVIAVPTRYPTGGAKQLIRVLTGREIPASRRSPEMGVQCFNVGTAYSAWRFIAFGEPLLSRIVTLTGNVDNARNWETLIGTPFREFVALGAPRPDTQAFLMGGPMMGFEIPGMDIPVVKSSNCVIAASPSLFPPPPPPMPCIRCGACANACPQRLQPFELYRFSRARNFDRARTLFLEECIECGCCAYVCPSRIPLVQYFRFAKSGVQANTLEKQKAEATRSRVERRREREARAQAEKAERLSRPAAANVIGTGENAPGTEADAQKKAAIQAAIERARRQQEAAQIKNAPLSNAPTCGEVRSSPPPPQAPDASTNSTE